MTPNRNIAARRWAMLTVFIVALLLNEQPADPHVRASDLRIRALMIEATDRSPTFRSLIAKLNDSDVIVYLVAGVTRDGLGGYLLNRILIQGPYRSLRLIVNPHGRDERVIAVIAHELQHALEVAQASEVGRSETVESLFGRIGLRSGCPRDCYETTEAMNMERRVREELRAHRSTTGPARP
jgi:hypothetical protein